MKYLYGVLFFLSAALLLNGYSKSNREAETIYEIAFMPDIHFHDVFAEFDHNDFPGLPTEYNRTTRNVSIRSMEAQLTSTRLFNENYFAFIAALDDAVQRGIKIIALPGDFSDDGQPAHVEGLVEILKRYKQEYDLQFFIAPGNHDPTTPLTTEAGKRDYLGENGRLQPIFSHDHPTCRNRKSTPAHSDSNQSNTHPVVCTDQVKEMGYSELFERISDFGLIPTQSFLHYETPFATFDNTPDEPNTEQFSYESRLYEICNEGSGGEFRKSGYTACSEVMDMSYLVEPIEGLWLLSIDANVYVPRQSREDSTKIVFSGSGNAGYNKVLTHKKHLLGWMKDVAARAEKNNKTLVAFSHFPAADFYNGAKPKIEALWGENEFQMARLPADHTSRTFAQTGIKLHIAGHMHMNGTEVVSDPASGQTFANIQVPSLAAYVPAYKILRTARNTNRVEIETVIIDDVPNFDLLFPHYQKEWEYLNSIQYESIWDREILNSKNYAEYTNWHIKELSRLRFLPREWPDDVKIMLSALTGKEMLILSQLESPLSFKTFAEWVEQGATDIQQITESIDGDWRAAVDKAEIIASAEGVSLHELGQWNGSDLSVDFYKIRNAGGLALHDISKERIAQYQLIASALHNSIQSDGDETETDLDVVFKNRFKIVFDVMTLFSNRLPDTNFELNLETGKIESSD